MRLQQYGYVTALSHSSTEIGLLPTSSADLGSTVPHTGLDSGWPLAWRGVAWCAAVLTRPW